MYYLAWWVNMDWGDRWDKLALDCQPGGIKEGAEGKGPLEIAEEAENDLAINGKRDKVKCEQIQYQGEWKNAENRWSWMATLSSTGKWCSSRAGHWQEGKKKKVGFWTRHVWSFICGANICTSYDTPLTGCGTWGWFFMGMDIAYYMWGPCIFTKRQEKCIIICSQVEF